ncbi:unnamed protein product [Cuscuta campestris]|uniref:Peptidase S8/S53 domain-containing protein n=1 Tax=Cuscuta campestris TaxID=132261 RepID=A0A484NDJ2_9ASTE|nr:unnamed protein product [Cuscuta campestris]
MDSLIIFSFAVFLFIQALSISANKSTYIVHFDRSFMPESFPTQEQWYSSIVHSVKLETSSSTSSSSSTEPAVNNPTRLLYTYEHSFHGFSAVLSEDELEALENTPGFVSAYRDKTATLDTTHTFEFLSLDQGTGIWPASRYGDGVIVGVVDTGVWPESKSFKDDGMTEVPDRWGGVCEEGEQFDASMCNKKLVGVRYFNKGVSAANPNITIAMNSGRDFMGHGTHASSTVAGNYVEDVSFFGYAQGTATGIVPKARVAMYKVGWVEGMCSSDVLAGIDQAVADEVDVISISIRFDSVHLFEDPIAIASFGAMEKGILVSTSAGNSGIVPGKLHNGIPWVLTSAAGSTDRWLAGNLSLGNGEEITGWAMCLGGEKNTILERLPLIYNDAISACNSSQQLLSHSLTNGIIVCDHTDQLYDQMNNASRSGFSGGIFVSDNPALFESANLCSFPGVVISQEDSYRVINYARTGSANPYVSITFQQTVLRGNPAPVVASYTSRGPAPSSPWVLKPDIMAPGSLILASWIPGTEPSSSFNMVSGTSMACPHSSAIAALLKGAHPEWSPAAIRSAMVTTAVPYDNTNGTIKDSGLNYTAATPLAMGGGLVNPNAALDPGLIYDATPQYYINLLCSMDFTKTQIMSITRANNYECGNTSSVVDLNYPSFILLYTGNESTVAVNQTFMRTVTYVGDGPATYRIDHVVLPADSEISVNPKSLSFQTKYETQRYSLVVSYRGNRSSETAFGSIAWVDESGDHIVRSPIVISSMIHIW